MSEMGLEEARRIIALHECQTEGHSWDVIETFERPIQVTCARCGKSYDINDQPTGSSSVCG